MKKLILFFCFISVFTGATAIAQGTWSETYLSEHKDHLARAVSGNKVYFAGGYAVDPTSTYQFSSNKVEIYDVVTGEWTYDELSSGRDWLEGISVGNKVIFAGGWDTEGTFQSTVDIYNTLTEEWTVANLSLPRFSLTSVSVGEKVMFAGGWDVQGTQGQVDSRVDIYNTNTDEWSTAELSLARMGIGSAAVGDLAFFAGGLVYPEVGTEYPTNRIDIYNAATNTWDTASLSVPRFFLAATVVGNKILFAGGQTTTEPSNRVDIYDITTGTWSIDSLSEARAFEDNDQNAVTIGSKAYFVGGMFRIMTDYQADFNVIDIYDSATNTWETDYLPYNLFGHAVAGADGKLIVAGGASLDPLGLAIHNQVLIKEVVTSVDFSTHQVGNFEIYPNPTPAGSSATRLQFTAAAAQAYTLQITNLQGQLVTPAQTLYAGNSAVYLPSLPAGMYFVTLTSGKQVQTLRWVVQ